MLLIAWRVSLLYDNKTLTFGQVGLAKATVTRLARKTVALARAALGGNGIITDFGVAKHFADIGAFNSSPSRQCPPVETNANTWLSEACFTYEGTYDINALYVTDFLIHSLVTNQLSFQNCSTRGYWVFFFSAITQTARPTSALA